MGPGGFLSTLFHLSSVFCLLLAEDFPDCLGMRLNRAEGCARRQAGADRSDPRQGGTAMNGNGGPGDARPGRRVRVDRSVGGEAMPAPMSVKRREGAGSGRVFVTAAVIAVLVLWGSLYLAFRQWRARYRERAAFGAAKVAAAV